MQTTSVDHSYNPRDWLMLKLGLRVRYCRIETWGGELVAIIRSPRACDRWFKRNDPGYKEHDHKMFNSFGQALANRGTEDD